MIIIGWFFGALIVGMLGSDRTSGFWGSFLISLLLSPIVGIIIVFLSQRKSTIHHQQQMMNYQHQQSQALHNIASKKDFSAELERLAKLKADGVLSEEEFNKLKAKLLE